MSEHQDYNNYQWVLVHTTNTQLDAEMLKSNLESADIPTSILSQVDTTRMFTIGHLAIVKIFVPTQFYSDAKKIIDLIEKGDSEEFM